MTEELIDAVRSATGGRCAVALRMSMQELRSRPSDVAESEAHEVVGLLRDAPDLFDVKMGYSAFDCSPSRFSAQGSHEPVIDFMKSVTDKPVVGVGRFTSPGTMVSMVKRGVLDLIVGARGARSGLAEELRALGAASVHLTGDAHAPGALVHAIYHAHRVGREVAAVPVLPRNFAVPG